MSWRRWTRSLLTDVKSMAALVAALGALATGIWSIDGRYAKAEDVRQQVLGVKELYLQSERRALQRQKFELDVARQQRPLTPIERQRLMEVDRELEQLEQQLKGIRPQR